MWKAQLPRGYIGIDIRPEVHPDIIGDAKRLPIRKRSTCYIYFDPPHHQPAKGFWGNDRYGEGLTTAQRLKLFVEANKEFINALREEGLVITKVTDMPKNRGFSNQQMGECLKREFTNFEPIKECSRPSRGFSSEATVHWIIFERRLKDERV